MTGEGKGYIINIHLIYGGIKVKKILKLSVAAVFIMIIMFMIFMTASDENIIIREYSKKSSKVTESKKFVLITDLHSVMYGENQEILIEKINEITPDAIFLGGDIVDDKRDERGSKIFLEYIGDRYECYYVSGNHEYWSYEIDSIKNMIRGYGIKVLEGEGVKINDEIAVWGVDDPVCENNMYGSYDSWYGQIDRCNEKINKGMFNILLSHRPERTDDYNKCDFDMVLSGHAHGGQWRIPYLLNGIIAPDQGFLPKYAGGYYRLENYDMIVSRGLALSNIPRIFNPPEIIVLNIE